MNYASPSPSDNFLRSWPFYFICGLLIGVVGVVTLKKISQYYTRPEPFFALFELKVYDDIGQPIGGASIFRDKINLGTTDTYGEWKRYVEVVPGTQLEIKVVKPEQDNKNAKYQKAFFASKVFAISTGKISKDKDEIYRASLTLKKHQFKTPSSPVAKRP